MLGAVRLKSSSHDDNRSTHQRITSTERIAAEFCDSFTRYNRKVSHLRDKTIQLVETSQNCVQNCTFNSSLVEGFTEFATVLNQLSDHCDKRVDKIDTNVVRRLFQYEEICKRAKEEIRHLYAAKEHEITKRRQLDRIKQRTPGNRHLILQAEAVLMRATAEVSKKIQQFEEKSSTFEKQKLTDIKKVFLNFVVIELEYHARALELFTKAYKHIDMINENKDLEEYVQATTSSKTITKKSSGDKNNGITTLFTRKPQGIPKGLAAQNRPRNTSTTEINKSTSSLTSDEEDSNSECTDISELKMKK